MATGLHDIIQMDYPEKRITHAIWSSPNFHMFVFPWYLTAADAVKDTDEWVEGYFSRRQTPVDEWALMVN